MSILVAHENHFAIKWTCLGCICVDWKVLKSAKSFSEWLGIFRSPLATTRFSILQSPIWIKITIVINAYSKKDLKIVSTFLKGFLQRLILKLFGKNIQNFLSS